MKRVRVLASANQKELYRSGQRQGLGAEDGLFERGFQRDLYLSRDIPPREQADEIHH